MRFKYPTQLELEKAKNKPAMLRKEVKEPDRQFDLFSSSEEKRVKTESLDRRDKYKAHVDDLKKSSLNHDEIHDRRSILRGFIALYFNENPDEILKRPLECLTGKSLENLIEKYWPLCQGWVHEVRLHKHEREIYVKENISK